MMPHRTRMAVGSWILLYLMQCLVFRVAADEPAKPFDKKEIGDLRVVANREVKAGTEKFYVLQATDKREIRDYVTKAFKIEKAWPVDIAGYLQNMVNLEKGFVSYVTPPVNPGEDPKRPGWVVVTAPDFMIPGIEEVVKSLDYTGFEFNLGDYSSVLKLKNRRPSDIAALLKNAAILSAQATVLPDDITNQIYVADGGAAMEDAFDMIKALDSPVPQVLIEAQIVEIEEGQTRKLGLDWEAWKNTLPANMDAIVNYARGKADQSALAGNGTPLASVNMQGISPQALAQFIEHLTNTGRAHVLSRPRVVAVNGKTAEISSLEMIPFTTIAQPNTDKSLNTPLGRERVDAQAEVGLRMTVTPLIGAETINLNIDAQLSSLVGYSRDDRPIISRRHTTSDATLRSGETFVLGGLSREWVVKEIKGFPVLKDVRGIRYFFGKEIESKRRSEVLILIKPTCVRPDANQPKGADQKIANGR